MSNMGYFVPKLLEETVGAKFNVIAGYQGGNESILRWKEAKSCAVR
jgi:hypothetical protein